MTEKRRQFLTVHVYRAYSDRRYSAGEQRVLHLHCISLVQHSSIDLLTDYLGDSVKTFHGLMAQWEDIYINNFI